MSAALSISARATLAAARREGITVALSEGSPRIGGPRAAVERWAPTLRACRDQLIAIVETEQQPEAFDTPDVSAQVAPKSPLGPADVLDRIEERAAIHEYDAGFPREWAEGFAKVVEGPIPPGYSPKYWSSTLDGALRFTPATRTGNRLAMSLRLMPCLASLTPSSR